MRVLVTGAAGMVGRKLCERLARDGRLGERAIAVLTMSDLAAPAPLLAAAPFAVEARADDLTDPGDGARLVADAPDVILHLAATVSGEAESNFEKGYAINLDGARHLYEAIRKAHVASGGAYTPRVVATSSIAVFGAPFPETIGDDFFHQPLTSYGAQKAITELLLSDYTRKGYFDGIALRLPTIVVRPGKPNAAASGFFSNIIREPLKGQDATLPVGDDVLHWLASPRAAVGFLIHAATMDSAQIGPRRALTMPGVGVTVRDQIEALRRVAGDKAVAHVKRVPDPAIAKIVAGWPTQFTAARATALGFKAEANFDEIIRAHIEDEMGGEIG
ncbi:MAG: SDR family oxidoreductase [Rhodoblastus sp.]|nr:MAG: SDR family oxidoreductase [Rhodoblastus sp.]